MMTNKPRGALLRRQLTILKRAVATVSATAVLLFTSAYSAPVLAGSFSVSPVRIYMSAKDRATAITVVNEGDEDIVMQADLYEWKQKPGGEDDLKLTEEMFLSPPIIKLAAKSRQVVRLARLVSTPTTAQMTYRMIVREIPEAKPPSKDLTVQIALAFSLPVFITPPGVKSKVICTAERVSASSINAVCENSGNAYARPISFTLNNSAGAKIAEGQGGYVLPGIKRAFLIDHGKEAITAGDAKLVVPLDDGTTEAYPVTIPQ